MRAPDTDTFDLHEVFDERVTFHFVKRAMLDGAVGKFLREVFDVRDFLARQTSRAKFLDGHFAHGVWSRESVPPLLGWRLLGLFALSGAGRFVAALFLSGRFREVRKSRHVSSMEVFFSVLGFRSIAGVNQE